jgi:hypothetical protein
MTKLYQREYIRIPIGVRRVAGIPVHDYVDVAAVVVEFTQRTMTLKIEPGEMFAGRLVKVVNGQIDAGPICRCGHPEWHHANNDGRACEINGCACKRFEPDR